MSGWIAQRECAACGFSGPETEFVSAVVLSSGDAVVAHRNDGVEGSVLLCGGCGDSMLRMRHDDLVAFWGRIVLAQLGRDFGLLDAPAPTIKAVAV